ncbi:hypothetical protein GCM10010431_83960 [Streptomyces kunmingensis]
MTPLCVAWTGGHTAKMDADPIDGLSAGNAAQDTRGYTGNEQQQVVDRRDRAARTREAEADEREHTADAREAEADERERVADVREAAADARESAADTWQEEIAGRERNLDERARTAGDAPPGLTQRSYEEIERAEMLLRSSQARLQRRRTSLRRSEEADLREQGAVDRESAASVAPHAEHQLLSVRLLEAKADGLRSQTVGALEELAAVEDALVRQCEQQEWVSRAAAHRHCGEQARTAAGALRAVGSGGRDAD